MKFPTEEELAAVLMLARMGQRGAKDLARGWAPGWYQPKLQSLKGGAMQVEVQRGGLVWIRRYNPETSSWDLLRWPLE